MENVVLQVQGMSCNHCVQAIEKAVGSLAGVASVKVRLSEAEVDVAFDSAKITVEAIKETIDDQGYDVE
ncbi:copper chaperone CopZ [Brevibacillus laterosporus]|uniref:Copper chaperone CopZ n=1 Tax=Brevibacillus laterosporus TaxID=1465 RepID=A0AAP3GC86_BRELA|nr:copper chaperone CopZ [Brevibacillus laterosporus]ATO48882.1 copper resistance protein CopZ [Brevibacillus laterosporus DSM 25]AYB41086.1 copper resistance protein CopZ [Brevibacillus laterosporus]MBG9775306.1 copper resistance protein CopZ [Brevibacillus laterosporus]MBG9790024.1 copper resistance protein CopZ [Brevibacillus laterosporus]MBG9799558.1 copper resistance protein CopZ [Brevibacillus laterosporus]